MKNIDGEKLWAYLDAKFSEFGEEYERQFERAKAKSDEMPAIISRMTAANEKRNFIINLRNEILSGKFDA